MEEVYRVDSYLKELEGRVIEVTPEGIKLDKTIFHPREGGLEADSGSLIRKSGEEVKVIDVKRMNGEVLLVVDKPLDLGENVLQKLNFEKRFKLMRLHTASHIIANIMFSKYNASIIGGNITEEYARDEFPIGDKDMFLSVVDEANKIASQGIELKVYELEKEKAMQIPGIVKLGERMPPDVKIWRIVEIPGVDIQADGGPHVRNTKEIGRIIFVKFESKGKDRKRMYYTVE